MGKRSAAMARGGFLFHGTVVLVVGFLLLVDNDGLYGLWKK